MGVREHNLQVVVEHTTWASVPLTFKCSIGALKLYSYWFDPCAKLIHPEANTNRRIGISHEPPFWRGTPRPPTQLQIILKSTRQTMNETIVLRRAPADKKDINPLQEQIERTSFKD